jgi:hypothetical protein
MNAKRTSQFICSLMGQLNVGGSGMKGAIRNDSKNFITAFIHWRIRSRKMVLSMFQMRSIGTPRKSVSATKLRQFADENQIVSMLAVMQPEFKRAVAARWKKIFARDKNRDDTTPWNAWQIL